MTVMSRPSALWPIHLQAPCFRLIAPIRQQNIFMIFIGTVKWSARGESHSQGSSILSGASLLFLGKPRADGEDDANCTRKAQQV
jgi:hypothetical protein